MEIWQNTLLQQFSAWGLQTYSKESEKKEMWRGGETAAITLVIHQDGSFPNPFTFFLHSRAELFERAAERAAATATKANIVVDFLLALPGVKLQLMKSLAGPGLVSRLIRLWQKAKNRACIRPHPQHCLARPRGQRGGGWILGAAECGPSTNKCWEPLLY